VYPKGAHALDPAAENVLAGHAVQLSVTVVLVLALSLYWPAMHSVQVRSLLAVAATLV
jgi:hypothetical protein